MKNDRLEKILFEDRMGCFGCFEITDTICRTRCALSLRCAIERDQNDRMEILEELVTAEGLLLRTQ